ncbi:MAG: hypothetical protein DRN49_05100, partial [Thaumarchaeota archaeon]
QLPAAEGPYGLRVKFQGVTLYDEIDVIDTLYETEYVEIRVPIYKIKLLFVDCHNVPIPDLWFKFTLPGGETTWDHTTDEGEYDWSYMPAGTLTIHAAWWKGVELPLMEAKDATGEELPLTDGKLILNIEEGVDSPIVIKIPIKDLIFYTTDFQGEMKIPRLNITLTWLGTYKPWATEEVYFLETLDPTGDEEAEHFNTSIAIHPVWFRYEIDTFFHKIADDSPMEGLSEYEAKYVFYQMPPTIYNITVTTVTDPEYTQTEQSPGNSKWPGRDIPVPYEIKIDWKWAENRADSTPVNRTTPAKEVNDRVVLRIFGSMNGVPVTTENFPADLVEAWNPDLIGIRTELVCEEEITLKTWAHDFWKRVINGDLRVGDAEFKVVNDNGREMLYYNIEDEKWEARVSKWTEDIKDISAIMRDSYYTSTIYWNGSYLLTNLRFETNMTYSYSKGENASFMVDKFYNASAPNDVADVLNFTLVGTEKLWRTSRRFAYWEARIEGNTWKDWYPAWFLVYELPTPEDEYKVEAAADGKGILPVPIPVAFVKLKAFAKDGTTPLKDALIELWALHINDAEKLDISAEKGSGVIDFYSQHYDGECGGRWTTVYVDWEWEKKLKETEKPQIFEEAQWDRLKVTFRTYKWESYTCDIPSLSVSGINLTNTLRDTRLATVLCGGDVIEIWLHYVGHDKIENDVTYTVELKINGDLVDAETKTFPLTGTETFEVGPGVYVNIDPTDWSDEEGVWVVADVDLSGSYEYKKPSYELYDENTIFVQVPPSPAKLILRDVVSGWAEDIDVAISRDYIYPLIDSTCEVDRNVGYEDKWATPDGLLAYGRWYTDEDGYVDSFKDLGPDDPRYGTVVLPIGGWLNATFHDANTVTEDEFHYQINVVWKSAVVYSDNLVLDKTGYEIKPTEVYSPTFYMALCNSTDTVVKGLYVTIWYPNVTIWHDTVGWTTSPAKPEVLESIEDLPIYLSANELWAEGEKSFELVPGPRFMNTTWKYTFLANHSKIDWLDNLVHTTLVLNNETFGDDGLRASGSLTIDVPIMLAAAKSVLFEVLTWRDEAGIATAYPIPDYTVKYVIRNKKAGVVAAEGEAVTDAEGKVVIP